MKPEVWDLVVQPMLARSEGGALFTGTPDGKNHFYDLYLQGNSADKDWDDWASFNWGTKDNPEIPKKEIESMEQRMTKEAFLQEALGQFVSGSSDYFKESYLQYADAPPGDGNYYIAIDPAGYDSGDALIASQLKKKDEFAISVVHVSQQGWFIEDIIHGRWGIREASLQIVKAFQKYRPTKIGIEKGALKKAIEPYLVDQMKRLNIFFTPWDLSHGGNSKTDRIVWALQGRAEHGRLILNKKKKDWHRPFIEQLLDFPNPMAHDDLIDATAYIDQLASTVYFDGFDNNGVDPIDADAGY
jgi:predicted phage terminase large subunit-like protein